MSKPAARIGDMHVCPMVTPGTPPIPHVGGPVTGPGVPTVLIGGMPAAVMGDMCVCTGPPDTITLGSTGVMIGGKPAARMGDMCVHGGSIVVGCPTVLIGEVSPDGMSQASAVVNNVLVEIEGFEGGAEGAQAVRQVLSLKNAASEGVAFCELCEANVSEVDNYYTGASSGDVADSQGEDEEPELEKMIDKLYYTDLQGNPITEIDDQEAIFLNIESKNIIGEEVLITLYSEYEDMNYSGRDIENGQVLITIESDSQRIKLELKNTAEQ